MLAWRLLPRNQNSKKSNGTSSMHGSRYTKPSVDKFGRKRNYFGRWGYPTSISKLGEEESKRMHLTPECFCRTSLVTMYYCTV
jgi:hypothetical protein